MTMVRAEDIPMPRRVTAFVFFMLADFFYGWAWNTVDILRPDIRAALQLSLPQAGTMYSAQAAGALVGAVIIAQLADRLGRRNALFGIMIGYGLALGAGAYVTSYEQVIVQRFVLGLFLGAVFPIVVGLYTGLFDRRICGRLAGFYNGTFFGAGLVLGLLANRFNIGDWHTLILIGAIPPLLLAPFTYIFVQDDRKIIPFGAVDYKPLTQNKLPIFELFAPDLWKMTLLLATMVGLNFFGNQAFNGWQTTYLTEVQGIDAAAAKEIYGWQLAASVLAGFVWGIFSDRFGRRVNAAGFGIGAVFILLYVTLANGELSLLLLGCLYGMMIASSVIWGPWIAELFPPHLRSTAASIFNWGRIISFFAPPITGAIAETYGLRIAMGTAAIAFGLAALIWLMLPETIGKDDPAETFT
jgi:MFS family permease